MALVHFHANAGGFDSQKRQQQQQRKNKEEAVNDWMWNIAAADLDSIATTKFGNDIAGFVAHVHRAIKGTL